MDAASAPAPRTRRGDAPGSPPPRSPPPGTAPRRAASAAGNAAPARPRDGAAQVGLDLAPFRQGQVHRGVEGAGRVPPLRLRLVEGEVGAPQDRLLVGPVGGRRGDADAGADLDRLVGEPDRPGDLPDAGFRPRHRVARSVDRGEEDREFVTAEPRRRVLRRQDRLQALRDLAQQRVAREMSECVVDLLEAVEIDAQDRAGSLAALDLGEPPPQPLAEQDAVGQVGEGVVGGQVGDPALGLLAHVDVDVGAHEPGRPPARVAPDDFRAREDPPPAAVLAPQPVLALEDGRVSDEVRPELRAGPGPVVGMDQRLPGAVMRRHLARLVAEHVPPAVGGPHRAGGEVAIPQAVAARVERQGQAFLALLQRLAGADHLVDVERRADPLDDGARLHDRRDDDRVPAIRAGGILPAQLLREGALLRPGPFPCGGDPGPVVRVLGFEAIRAGGGPIAEVRLIALIAVVGPAVAPSDPDHLRQRVGEGPHALLAREQRRLPLAQHAVHPAQAVGDQRQGGAGEHHEGDHGDAGGDRGTRQAGGIARGAWIGDDLGGGHGEEMHRGDARRQQGRRGDQAVPVPEHQQRRAGQERAEGQGRRGQARMPDEGSGNAHALHAHGVDRGDAEAQEESRGDAAESAVGAAQEGQRREGAGHGDEERREGHRRIVADADARIVAEHGDEMRAPDPGTGREGGPSNQPSARVPRSTRACVNSCSAVWLDNQATRAAKGMAQGLCSAVRQTIARYMVSRHGDHDDALFVAKPFTNFYRYDTLPFETKNPPGGNMLYTHKNQMSCRNNPKYITK